MTASLLSTKLRIPPLRQNAVSRPRLVRKLLSSLDQPGKFILLAAPAGFGKTTLLSEFVLTLQSAIAWVSLDGGDNDPVQFWTYVITALQSSGTQVGNSALKLLQGSQPLPDEAVPTLLINELTNSGSDIVLVLDDYHVIQNTSLHNGLAFLLDHPPENLHMVVSTRIDPPWPLARLRARGQLAEIRSTELRFTIEEATQFLNEVMDLDLSAEDVAALEARTEGWVASLQLAAISMEGRSDVSGFIRAFTGSHVYVAEYLMDEVLGRQPEDVTDFLLKTSILERLNASLCEAVSAHSNSQTVLKQLYQANLFIIPLDEEGKWFRYHRLFADLLQARLHQSFPAVELKSLHQRAAVWYEQAGMMNEAMEHLLTAVDYSQAVTLLEKIAPQMIMKAYFKTVEDWLTVIPSQYILESARLNMTFAWMFLMRRDPRRAGPYLEQLQLLFASPEAGEKYAALQGEWLALRSILLGAQGKATESRDAAEHALRFLPEDQVQVRIMTHMGLANAYRQMLDYERATQAAEAMIQESRRAGDLTSEIFGLSFQGLVVLEEGRLHEAHEIALQGLRLAERAGSFSPFSATLHGELAQIYYHWHRLNEARVSFERSVQWSLPGGFSDAQIYNSVFLSRLFQMEGKLQESIQEIEKAVSLMQTAAPSLVGEEVISQQVSIFLALDRIAEAQAALQPYGFRFEEGFSYPEPGPDTPLSHPRGLLYNSALRILLHQARKAHEHTMLKEGIDLAGLVLQGSFRARHLPIALQTLLLRAQLYVAAGEDPAGLADVARTLELAEPEGFISIFLEEGQPVAELVTALLKRHMPGSVQASYVQQILAAFPKAQSIGTVPSRAVDPDLSPIEPLTPREQEVLQLIAAGDSNQAIADKLVITLSAVKKHTGNIFQKLNVSNRTQAVARARLLGLLPTEN
jgi:LuxR family transcriptional regulator, maltose regulon positive regulatory protein